MFKPAQDDHCVHECKVGTGAINRWVNKNLLALCSQDFWGDLWQVDAMKKMAKAWLGSCAIYTVFDTKKRAKLYKTHAADTHEAVLRIYATLGER